jgi:hypothetical protein
MINIDIIIEKLKLNFVFSYYFLIFFWFFIQFFSLLILNLNRNEERFLNNILMFIIALNCFNFIFVNIGIGIILTIILLPIEFVLISIETKKKVFIKFLLNSSFFYVIIIYNDLINSMVKNFIEFNCNVYVIVSITLFLVGFRIVLSVFEGVKMVLRKEDFGDYDDDYFDDDEDENNNENNNKNDNNKNDNDKSDKNNSDKNNSDKNNNNNKDNEKKRRINQNFYYQKI